jgi:hypothetical protein
MGESLPMHCAPGIGFITGAAPANVTLPRTVALPDTSRVGADAPCSDLESQPTTHDNASNNTHFKIRDPKSKMPHTLSIIITASNTGR